MKITLTTTGLCALFSIAIGTAPGLAQPDVSHVSVSVALLKKHVYLLASDSLQGRLTGTTGQLQAAFYCTRTFRQLRLTPLFPLDSGRRSYRQTYPFMITDAANFGPPSTYRSPPTTYKRYELVSPPLTARDSTNVLFGDNLGGLLVGTDLKQQVVVVSAHYDHLGRLGSRIYHGADDNASGTAAVLGMASTFDSLAQLGIRSRRSILFLLFSGEEGGLIGSKYFVANSPIPLNQLVCDLNVDMVGRVDYEHQKHPDYCYIITGNQVNGFKDVAKLANEQSVHLALNQGGYDTKNDPSQYFYRSDHFNFARFGIPVLFFMDGDHPDYHQTTDTADKIVYDLLQKRATLVFQTAWRVANPTPDETPLKETR